MIRRKLVAVQDFGPGVAVTSHDGRAAPLDGLAQAAAGVDEPAEGKGLRHLWAVRLGVCAGLCCTLALAELVWGLSCVLNIPKMQTNF